MRIESEARKRCIYWVGYTYPSFAHLLVVTGLLEKCSKFNQNPMQLKSQNNRLQPAAGSRLKFPFICYTGLLKKCLKFNQNPINSQNFRLWRALSYTFLSLFYYRIVEKELQIQSKAHKFSKFSPAAGSWLHSHALMHYFILWHRLVQHEQEIGRTSFWAKYSKFLPSPKIQNLQISLPQCWTWIK